MRQPESEARRLAVVLLADRFDEKTVLQQMQSHVSGSKTWMQRVASGLISRFGDRRPRRRQLVHFLLNSPAFLRAARKASFAVRYPDAASAFVSSPGLFRDTTVRPLETTGHIAEWLGLTEGELLWFADPGHLERVCAEGPLRHYRYHWKRKRHGRCRLIEAPKFRTRTIQRTLLRDILNHVPVHDAAHGFRRQRSVRSHAAPHVGKAIVLKMDLEDFFPAIPPPRLTRILMHVGYSEEIADFLTALCCNYVPPETFKSFPHPDDWNQFRQCRLLYGRAHFPQGAPTSPAAANICAFRMDSRLAGLAKSANAVYTRYADDLLFSGDAAFVRNVDRFRISVAAIAMEEGFHVNHRKTCIMKRSTRQEAVGLVLNEKLNLPRQEFDRLRATLHRCVLKGPAAVNNDRHADFRAHLIGRIQYVAQSSDSRRARLNRLFDQIVWTEGM
ncbi:MAG: reverse transcriptase family protein [Planctomycetaceae bacterium]